MLSSIYLGFCLLVGSTCSNLHREDQINVIVVEKSADLQKVEKDYAKSLAENDYKRKVKKWKEILPFFAQDASNLGYDIPLPFSVSVVSGASHQISNIKFKSVTLFGIDFADPNTPVRPEKIKFSDSSSTTKTVQLRLTAFIFPFLQIGTSFGSAEGNGGNLNVNIPRSALKICDPVSSPIPGRPPTIPVLCKRLIPVDGVKLAFTPTFEGHSYSFNITYAEAINDIFFVMPIVYALTTTTSNSITQNVFLTSPRLGYSFNFNKFDFKVYAGYAYLYIKGLATDKDYLSSNNIDLSAVGLGYRFETSGAGNGSNSVIGGVISYNDRYSINGDFTIGKYTQNYIISLSYNY